MLVLTTTFPKSKNDFGTPRFVFDLSKNLSERNIKTIVLTPDRPDCKENIEIITKNYWIFRFKYFLKKNKMLTNGEGIIPNLKKTKRNLILIPFLIIFQLLNTIRIIRKNKIDIITSHWLVPSGFLGAIMQKFLKRKNYVIVHAAGLYLLEKIPLGNKLANFIYRNSTRFFIVSNYGKQQFYKLLSKPDIDQYNKKVKVLPMGTYTNILAQEVRKKIFPKNSFNILFLGRIVEKKGLIYAIEAIRKMKNMDIYFHICGNGPLIEDLKKFTKENNLTKNVIFYGRITENEKMIFLNSADVLLVPSIETPEGDKEGLPVVILEALSTGLPIIATNVGGISDGVIHQYTGFLIEQKSVEKIIQAINELKSNVELLESLSNNCVIHSKKFDWAKIADKHIIEIIETNKI